MTTIPTIPTRASAAEFDEALRLLDHELSRLRLEEPLKIRAIGGYALLKHGVREDDRALTADIDTVTRDYSAPVQEAIRAVSRRTGLDADWINNVNLGFSEPEDIEASYQAEWIPLDMGLKNIDLAIGSIPMLTRSKIIAADTAMLAGRLQDHPDLAALLRHQGITDVAQFRAKYPDPFGEYAETDRFVHGHFGGPAPDSEPRDELDDWLALDCLEPSFANRMKDRLSERVADLDWGNDAYDGHGS